MVYCLIPAERPLLIVPSFRNVCISDGQGDVNVTFPEISANNTDGNPVLCTVNGDDVNITGHVFSAGSYTVNCSVQNNAGCNATNHFPLVVSGQRIFFRIE